MTPPAGAPWATPSPRPSLLRRLAGGGADLANARRARWSRAPRGAGPAPTAAAGTTDALRSWHHTHLGRAWAVAGTELLVGGAEQLDAAGGLVLVANHQHPRDADLVRAALPDPLSRRVRVLSTRAARLLARVPRLPGTTPEVLLVFGDGSPSPDGTVGTFDPVVVELARRRGARLVPVAIRGSFALSGRDSRLAGALAGDPHRVAVRFGPPLPADHPGGGGTTAEVASPDQAAAALRAAVLALITEDETTWWRQQQGVAPAPTPGSTWRRVWAATAPARDVGTPPRRRIWR